MHAATLESPNPVRVCVKPFQESVKQRGTQLAVYLDLSYRSQGVLRTPAKKRGRPACESDLANSALSMQVMPDRHPTTDCALTQTLLTNCWRGSRNMSACYLSGKKSRGFLYRNFLR